MLQAGAVSTVTTEFGTVQVNWNTVPFVCTVVAVAVTNPSFRATISVAVFDFTCRAAPTTIALAVAAIAVEFVAVEVNCNTIPFVRTVVAVAVTNPSFRATISVAVFDFTCRAAPTTIALAIAAIATECFTVEPDRDTSRTAVTVVCRNVRAIIAVSISNPVGVDSIFKTCPHAVW